VAPPLESARPLQAGALDANSFHPVLCTECGVELAMFDHAEVLYDLDIEASEEARRLGLELHRASTVADHPAFVEMFVELIRQRLPLARAWYT
jgi:hypothetical protein